MVAEGYKKRVCMVTFVYRLDRYDDGVVSFGMSLLYNFVLAFFIDVKHMFVDTDTRRCRRGRLEGFLGCGTGCVLVLCLFALPEYEAGFERSRCHRGHYFLTGTSFY